MTRSAVDATVNTTAWEHIADAFPAGQREGIPPARVEWTPYPGYGPGTELLGDLTAIKVIELGCGTGDNLACVASAGAAVSVGVDISAARIAQARARWGNLPGVSWRTADAADALASDDDGPYDVCYSVFGALWYADPQQLLPRVAARLRPGGLLVFSTGCPRPCQLAGRRVDNLTLHDGTRLPVIQYAYPLSVWKTLLDTAGFTVGPATELPPPGGDRLPTLLLRAHRRS